MSTYYSTPHTSCLGEKDTPGEAATNHAYTWRSPQPLWSNLPTCHHWFFQEKIKSDTFWTGLVFSLLEIYNQDFCSLLDMYMFRNGPHLRQGEGSGSASVSATLQLAVYRQSVHLVTSPLRLTTSNFIFQLNTCSYSPSVTYTLTRGWICCLQLLLVLASVVILRSMSCGTHDHLLQSHIRDDPNI
jgi:hypothetical protein